MEELPENGRLRKGQTKYLWRYYSAWPSPSECDESRIISQPLERSETTISLQSPSAPVPKSWFHLLYFIQGSRSVRPVNFLCTWAHRKFNSRLPDGMPHCMWTSDFPESNNFFQTNCIFISIEEKLLDKVVLLLLSPKALEHFKEANCNTIFKRKMFFFS